MAAVLPSQVTTIGGPQDVPVKQQLNNNFVVKQSGAQIAAQTICNDLWGFFIKHISLTEAVLRNGQKVAGAEKFVMEYGENQKKIFWMCPDYLRKTLVLEDLNANVEKLNEPEKKAFNQICKEIPNIDKYNVIHGWLHLITNDKDPVKEEKKISSILQAFTLRVLFSKTLKK